MWFLAYHFSTVYAHQQQMESKKTTRKLKAALKRDERDQYKRDLDQLLTDPERKQIEFPPSLQKSQRKHLHRYATSIGLKSKSQGTGE